MIPSRDWLGGLRSEYRQAVRSAIEAARLDIEEGDHDGPDLLVCRSAGAEIVIGEPRQSTPAAISPDRPTLWILAPGTSPPETEGGVPCDFVRMPSPRSEIAARARGLLRAALRRQQRGAIVATLAHEMASPLTAVLEYLEMLYDGTVDLPTESQKALILEARGAAKRVSDRIRELGDASRVEAGLRLDARIGRFDLSSPMSALRRWVEPTLRKAEQTLRVDLEPGLPPVATDPARILQLLRHLVDHLHKVAPTGATIRIEGGSDRNREGWARVLLTIDSAGSDPELGDPSMVRFDGSSPGSLAGTCRGGGWMLAPALADAIGGEIWVNASSDAGRRILLLVPLCRPRFGFRSDCGLDDSTSEERRVA